MKTYERVKRVADFFAGQSLGFTTEADLLLLLEKELGHTEILDRPIPQGQGVSWQAIAPHSIYHICASNLDVSAQTSLLLGLLLGSELIFKCPAVGLPQFENMAMAAATTFGKPITILKTHDSKLMQAADAVIAFGTDETVVKIKNQLLPHQRFLSYGHKISVGLVLPNTSTRALAERAALEIAAHEQLGCLSPQAYLCPDFDEALRFAEMLAEVLDHLEKTLPSAPRSFETEAVIFEARQRALLRGNRLWGASEKKPWTVVLRHDGFLEAGPGNRFIQVIPGSDWSSILKPWKGKLSSLAISDERRVESLLPSALELGFSRVCTLGKLQQPSLLWRHDGRPRLADLVTWLSIEHDDT